MKKLLAVLTVLAVSAPMVFAGSGLGVFATMWDAEDADDPGVGGGIKFKMEMMPNINLELRASYLQDFFDSDSGSSDLIMVPLEVDVVIDLPLVPDLLTLYGGGGAGFYIVPEYESDIAIPGSDEPDIDPDDELGFFAVGGAELQLNEQLSLFGEIKYNVLEIEGTEIDDVEIDFGDFDEDIDMGGIAYNVGLLLLW